MSKPSRYRTPSVAIAIALSLAVTAWAASRSTKEGVFTEEQVARGKLVYERSCQNCHQADFYRERLPKWENKTIGALFESVSTSMPADNVGSLPTSEYIDVLAYVFSITGSPTGKAELTTDTMDAIQIAPIE